MKVIGIVVILLLVLTGGGVAFFLSMSVDGSASSSNGVEALTGTAPNRTQPADASNPDRVGMAGKQDNAGNPNTVMPAEQPGAPGDVPADTSGLARIDGSVTALLSSTDGSVRISFYVQGPGYFTVQRTSSGTWQTLAENVYYSGTGGLPAATMAPDEQSVTLRLLHIDSGQYAATTQAMTVSRADVQAAGDVKTYKIP